MANVQIIKAPNGEEMVILSKAEYDALTALAAEASEDTADVAAYDAAMAELEAGKTSKLPTELSTLITKERGLLLRAIRKWRGLTQLDLSEKTGLGQGYISAIESRQRVGTEDTLRKIADALDVPPDWILPVSSESGRK